MFKVAEVFVKVVALKSASGRRSGRRGGSRRAVVTNLKVNNKLSNLLNIALLFSGTIKLNVLELAYL